MTSRDAPSEDEGRSPHARVTPLRLVDADGGDRERLERSVQVGLLSVGRLTGREREILGLMTLGWSNAAICEHLGLSGKTVESHVRNVFSKLGLAEQAHCHRRVLAARIGLTLSARDPE